MHARLILAIGLLATCGADSCSRAPSQAPPSEIAVVMPPVATQPARPPIGDPEPQDLVPVETRRSYGARDPDPLLDGVESSFSMVCMPSFTRSYAVALVTEDGDDPRCSVRFASDEVTERHPLEKGGDPRRLVEVEIEPESARRLEEAWESVVRRTRYPRPHYEYCEIDGRLERLESSRMCFDGTTYRFESGEYCGTTWSPRAELTWGIVELGDALRDYALANEAQRPKQLAHCLELAQKLQAAAERRPW